MMLYEYRVLLALLVAAVIGGCFHYSCKIEKELSGDYCGKRKPGRNTASLNSLALPMYLACFLLMFLIVDLGTGELDWLKRAVYKIFADVCIMMSAYFALLVLVMPLLRRFFSAKACATMWVIPTVLYLSFWGIKPKLVLTVNESFFKALIILWICGFSVVMIRYVVSHLFFRKRCLKNAAPITDAEILSLWQNEQWRTDIKGKIPLMRSPNVDTPMIIGVFRHSFVALVPADRHYSSEELQLIFYHELLHVRRRDVQSKIYMLCCTALCWFNPFAWIALRKHSEDLELSCDELVLNDADENVRRRYAELILKTGSSYGFTTCLSASAGTIRYRLRSIMSPARKLSGVLLLAISGAALMFCLGIVGFASESGTLSQLASPKFELSDFAHRANEATLSETEASYISTSVYAWKETELAEYLGSLQVKKLISNENYDYERAFELWEKLPTGHYCRILLLSDVGVRLVNSNMEKESFILVQEPNWEYIKSLMDFDAPDPDPAPVWPNLMLYFDGNIHPDGEPMYAVRRSMTITNAEESWEAGDEGGAGGVHGAEVTKVRFEFNYEPEYYNIRWESFDEEKSGSVKGGNLENSEFDLCPYSAHYYVDALFHSNRDTSYDVCFAFDVVLPEDVEKY